MSFAHTCRRRTPNPFILFRTEFAKRRPVQVLNVSATEVSKEAGAAWKALSAEQRAPYEEQARVLVAKHAAMHQGDVSQCTWKPQNRPIRLKEAKVTKKKPTPRAVIRPDPTVDFAAMCASLESNPQYRAAMAAQAAVMRGETLDSASRPPEAATPLDDPLAQSNPLINDIILPTTTGVSCGVNVASTAIEPMPHIGEPFPGPQVAQSPAAEVVFNLDDFINQPDPPSSHSTAFPIFDFSPEDKPMDLSSALAAAFPDWNLLYPSNASMQDSGLFLREPAPFDGFEFFNQILSDLNPL